MQELSRHGLILDMEGGVSEVCKAFQMGKQKKIQFAISTARSAAPWSLCIQMCEDQHIFCPGMGLDTS